MQVDKNLFEFGRRKASGFSPVMLLSEPSSDEDRHKVYLNSLGNEVHVQGDKVAHVAKAESLADKIKRFDRLAAYVRQNRAAQLSFATDFESGDGYTDEELNDDSFANDISADVDSFGDFLNPEPNTAPDAEAPADKPAAPQPAGPASEQAADASAAVPEDK